MKRSHGALALAAVTAAFASACTNPTVDPSTTFTVDGKALGSNGMPLANANVRLLRFFDQAKVLEPTVETLLACNNATCDLNDVGLEIGVVQSVKSDASGVFSFTVKGTDIAARKGITDAQGKVEVSYVVVVVQDPADTSGRSGVLSLGHLFQDTDPDWGAGDFQVLDSTALADVSQADVSGLVRFTWNKLSRDTSDTVKTLYRLEVSGDNSATLSVGCRESTDMLEGGCEAMGADKLSVTVSAYSIYSYYSDNGDFEAFLNTTGKRYRYRSRFMVPTPVRDPRAGRQEVGIAGIWAVTPAMNQSLFFTPPGPAHDGNIDSQATINGQAKEIYVKFTAPEIVTDAGLLNSLVEKAEAACVGVEFTTEASNTIDDAKALSAASWVKGGKFCGSVGAKNEMAAVISYDTTSSAGKTGLWYRYKVTADANVDAQANVYFKAVGEVVAFKKTP